MPFVQRVVTPKYVARSIKPSHSRGATSLPVQDYELEAITNLTLSNALRQLASLVLISNQIFTELNKELASVSERSLGIKQRIDNLSKRVEEFDPKQVTVRKYPSCCTLSPAHTASQPESSSSTSCLVFMCAYGFPLPNTLHAMLLLSACFLSYDSSVCSLSFRTKVEWTEKTGSIPCKIKLINFRYLMPVFPVPISLVSSISILWFYYSRLSFTACEAVCSHFFFLWKGWQLCS